MNVNKKFAEFYFSPIVRFKGMTNYGITRFKMQNAEKHVRAACGNPLGHQVTAQDPIANVPRVIH